MTEIEKLKKKRAEIVREIAELDDELEILEIKLETIDEIIAELEKGEA